MKKPTIFLLIVFFILAIGVFFPNPTFAQTTQQDTQALIIKLQEQIRALQEQVTKLQAEVSSTKTELEVVKTELKFTKALRLGATGDEVKQLQEFLKQFPDIYSQGLVTGYFGPLTEAAVRKFQEKQGIESIGVVGPKTLSKLNELVTEGVGKSEVIPPGLLIAPGIQGRIETITPNTTPTTPVATTTAPIVTTPTTTIPIQPTTAVPTGICLIKDRYTDIPRFDIANFGNGFAKYAVSGINTVLGLQTACTKTIYDYLLQNYCKASANTVQRLIVTYDDRGIAEAKNLTCGLQGCDFVDCSSVASLATIATPTTTPSGTITAVPATPATSAQPLPVTGTSTVPAISATPAIPAQPASTASTTPTATSAVTIASVSITVTPESTGATARAIITWNTNVPADSRTEYTETVFPGENESQPEMVTSHSMLKILKSSTTYKYRVKSMASGNLAISPEFTITTPARIDIVVNPSDTTPPVISGLGVRRGLDNLDTIIGIDWTTSEPADNQVEYGLTTSYGSLTNLYNYTLGTSHHNSIHAPESDIGKTYHFRARSKDASGNLGVSGDYTAMVGRTAAPDTTPPIISNLRAENITTSSAQIKWTTDEPAGDMVYWDTHIEGITNHLVQTRCTSGTNYIITDHCINLTGLPSNSIIYYQVKSGDASSNSSTSNIFQFNSVAISLTPPTGLFAIISGTNNVNVLWNPVESISNYRLYRRTAGGTTWTLLTDGYQPTNFTDIARPIGTYDYKVQACNGTPTVCSADSNYVSISVTVASIDMKDKKIAAISQIINSLNEILRELSQLLK